MQPLSMSALVVLLSTVQLSLEPTIAVLANQMEQAEQQQQDHSALDPPSQQPRENAALSSMMVMMTSQQHQQNHQPPQQQQQQQQQQAPAQAQYHTTERPQMVQQQQQPQAAQQTTRDPQVAENLYYPESEHEQHPQQQQQRQQQQQQQQQLQVKQQPAQQQQPQQPQHRQVQMQLQAPQQLPVAQPVLKSPPPPLTSYSASSYHPNPNLPLYLGHNPFIEILRRESYADDNIVTLNLSHSHIYEIDSDAFVGQRFEHIDLSNNKLGLIHSRSFRIGPIHSRHNPYNPAIAGSAGSNSSKHQALANGNYPTRRPPPAHPKMVTIDFSHNPAIVALSGAFDHIDVPNCLLNFTNSTVELKFGAFKKYFKEHPGHIIDIESVDCCEQEWLLGYKHNFVSRTHCDHNPGLLLSKVPQQTIIDSCIAYVTSARHSMTIQGPSIIHQVAAAPRSHSSSHVDSQYLTYVILGGTAMILTSLSIYIIFYMFSLKAAFVYQMQNKT